MIPWKQSLHSWTSKMFVALVPSVFFSCGKVQRTRQCRLFFFFVFSVCIWLITHYVASLVGTLKERGIHSKLFYVFLRVATKPLFSETQALPCVRMMLVNKPHLSVKIIEKLLLIAMLVFTEVYRALSGSLLRVFPAIHSVDCNARTNIKRLQWVATPLQLINPSFLPASCLKRSLFFSLFLPLSHPLVLQLFLRQIPWVRRWNKILPFFLGIKSRKRCQCSSWLYQKLVLHHLIRNKSSLTLLT